MGISVERLRSALMDEHHRELVTAQENLQILEAAGGANKFPSAYQALTEHIKETMEWIRRWTPKS
jgi:hypothetical protein